MGQQLHFLIKKGVVIAHKTGSGDVNENGVLAAHNDVAYICLPNNISYTLAVFVKDFKGNESQASQYVAHISAVVYSFLPCKYPLNYSKVHLMIRM